MRTIIRNSFARQSILSERVRTNATYPPVQKDCTECGNVRRTPKGETWLYRFHVDDDQGSRHSGPIAGGKLFCSRNCAESYTGQSFDETRRS